MTTQYTPGPWIIDRGQIRDTDGNSLTSVPYSLGGTQDYANAALISAAPDLLEALRFLLADYIAIQGDKLTGSTVPIDMAQAAIAKAEGAA